MSLTRQQRRAQERSEQKRANRQETTASGATPGGGPRTPEGKRISSQNSLTHGLTSARLVLPWEDESAFENLLTQLIGEHQPQTITESMFVRELAEQWWRLQRARNQEHTLMCRYAKLSDTTDPEALELEGQLNLVLRYATRHERAFHRCFGLLRTLQRERRLFEQEAEKAREEGETAQVDASSEFVSQNPPSPALQDKSDRQIPAAQLPGDLPDLSSHATPAVPPSA